MNIQLDTNENLLLVMKHVINSRLLDVNTMIPCKIIKVKDDNTIDVQPLLKDVMANGSLEEPPKIYNVPVLKLQGSNCLIAVELKVNDIGIVGFCQRDISGLINTKKINKPNTARKFSLSDGIWLGGILKTPDDFDNKIIIRNDKIFIYSKKEVTIDSTEKIKITSNSINIAQTIEDLLSVVNSIITAQIITPAGPATPIATTNPNLIIELEKIKQNLGGFK